MCNETFKGASVIKVWLVKINKIFHSQNILLVYFHKKLRGVSVTVNALNESRVII